MDRAYEALVLCGERVAKKGESYKLQVEAAFADGDGWRFD